MLNCPKCSRAGCPKDGVVKGKQYYKCKTCNYRYTVAKKGAANSIKRQTLMLYFEGLDFRSIGRFLDFSHVAVYSWIRGFGENVAALKSDHVLKVIEIDEMHSYVGPKKNYCWIGRLLLIDME